MIIAVSISLVIWLLKKRKGKLIAISVTLLLLIAYSFTYFPQQVVSIEPTNVSKINVFDGSTGTDLDITNQSDIDYIITNLNEITFKKGKPSIGYMGFSFRTTIYDHKDRVIKELIINSSDTIKYKGFFYTASGNVIDYEYIEKMINEKNQ
jgi:hypothetical protein